ncbi:hypothetical protein MRB53_026497 [Persea americana]|uniref:Uncharacterized protein n=1 Tax=Persea americana TaxID=3435 RepID=A0ACC2LI81_PERAE|nr:hypothetical protein MRB53_026497 [Persea americana]
MSKEHDPIERKLILAHDLATASDLKDIEKEVGKQNGSSNSKRKRRLAGTPEPSDAPEKARGPMEAAKERDREDEKQRLVCREDMPAGDSGVVIATDTRDNAASNRAYLWKKKG